MIDFPVDVTMCSLSLREAWETMAEMAESDDDDVDSRSHGPAPKALCMHAGIPPLVEESNDDVDTWSHGPAPRDLFMRAGIPQKAPSIDIDGGYELWREFLEASNMRYWRCAAALDLHNVIDTLTWDQASHIGIHIDHNHHLGGLMLSKGRQYREGCLNADHAYWPLVDQLDGFIFTDYDKGRHNTVRIYRDTWMMPDTIAVKGDKGQIAQLLGIPCLLFDDKWQNIDLMRERSSKNCILEGVQVLRGYKAKYRPIEGYMHARTVDDIIFYIDNFDRAHQG